MNIGLSNRLETIKKLVPNKCVPADIGADHGYLICSLIIDGIVESGYAVENKKGPFTHLNETINLYSLNDKVYPLFSSAREALDNLDMDEMEEVLAKLMKYQYPSQQQVLCTQLQEAVDNLDSDTCEEIILEWEKLLQ